MMAVDALAELPLAVARRLIRRAVERAKGDLLGIGFDHLSGVLDLAASGEGHGRLQIPGLDIFRSFNWLRLAPPGLDNLNNRNYRLPLPVPGVVALPGQWRGQRMVLNTELFENANVTEMLADVYNEGVVGLDWSRLSGPLEVRNWRPGDRYQPEGHRGAEKIKVLFHEARVPLWERRHWPVVTMGDEILWARRFGLAAGFAARRGVGKVLGIRENEA